MAGAVQGKNMQAATETDDALDKFAARFGLRKPQPAVRITAYRIGDALPSARQRVPWRLIPERARVPDSVDSAFAWQLFATSSRRATTRSCSACG